MFYSEWFECFKKLSWDTCGKLVFCKNLKTENITFNCYYNNIIHYNTNKVNFDIVWLIKHLAKAKFMLKRRNDQANTHNLDFRRRILVCRPGH